ncbi:MAG: hypothetical protein ACYC90_09285 [Candidatus Nanopelagicales bacterium]
MKMRAARTIAATAFAATLALTGVAGGTAAAAGNVTNRPAAGTFIMPRMVGANLQAAQDWLQSRGSYFMDQVDASGRGRLQIIDSGWYVCWQQPPPGTQVPVTAMIRLGVVKYGERCPR